MDWHFFNCTDCFDNKDDSSFLSLYRYDVVVKLLYEECLKVMSRSESAPGDCMRQVIVCARWLYAPSDYKPRYRSIFKWIDWKPLGFRRYPEVKVYYNYIKISKTILILGWKRIYNIRKTDCKLPIYKPFYIFKPISFIYQIATTSIKSINKYIKSSISTFYNEI